MLFIKTTNAHTEKELILQWQNGSEKAFEQLYHNHALALITIATHKTNDREISKELVQNVFITLYKNKDSAHEINSLRAYLYSTLKYRILDHFRKQLAQKKILDQSLQTYPGSTENDAAAAMQTRELELLLTEEIKKLPPRCQSVFILRREHELSNKQIARHLKISENTVEQHMRKALRMLKVAFNLGFYLSDYKHKKQKP